MKHRAKPQMGRPASKYSKAYRLAPPLLIEQLHAEVGCVGGPGSLLVRAGGRVSTGRRRRAQVPPPRTKSCVLRIRTAGRTSEYCNPGDQQPIRTPICTSSLFVESTDCDCRPAGLVHYFRCRACALGEEGRDCSRRFRPRRRKIARGVMMCAPVSLETCPAGVPRMPCEAAPACSSRWARTTRPAPGAVVRRPAGSGYLAHRLAP